jgi:hypothetical protein
MSDKSEIPRPWRGPLVVHVPFVDIQKRGLRYYTEVLKHMKRGLRTYFYGGFKFSSVNRKNKIK